MLAPLLLALLPVAQDPQPGISQDLARARAAIIRDVTYALHFQLDAGVAEVLGSMTLTFMLAAQSDPNAPLVLDFSGSSLTSVLLNQKPAAFRVVADHVLLPADMLVHGFNQITAQFRSAIAPTGTPLTSYRDPSDGREFYYTLVVPADAHRLYPCFDQPDLRARFQLELDLPTDWLAVANGAEIPFTGIATEGRRTWAFQETPPLPTYLAAFACGSFAVVIGPEIQAPGVPAHSPLRTFVRPSQIAQLDPDAIARLHINGLRWLCDYFNVEYPFIKLDIVLLPGFPYNGMEHAGAIFYREQALMFDHQPTDGELARRSTLIYHELSHQWFGNLVTMRWFDDLWLKEGFATFIAHLAMENLEPERKSWLRFLQRVKPRAYEVDGTPGTVPVFQALQNLADAKSAYGPIVYNKAPAVLRELYERIGAGPFRAGLTRFLRAHAFGNATWRDLGSALEATSQMNLSRWSERWLLAPSMPQVRVQWQLDAEGLVSDASLLQTGVNGEGSWPLEIDLCVVDQAGGRRIVHVTSDAPKTQIDDLIGLSAPACVIANPADVTYGQFVPDAVSRAWLIRNCAQEQASLLRAVMTSALLTSVQEAELDPALFAEVALQQIAIESDPESHAWLLDALGQCLSRWLAPSRAAPLRARASDLLLQQLNNSGGSGRELTTFRFLARQCADDGTIALCKAVCGLVDLPKGLAPGKADRFLAVAALLATGQESGELARLRQYFEKEDIGKELFLALAAVPTAASKASYWLQYLQLDAPPEQWTQDSLPFFNWPGQAALTFPYLQTALDQAAWVKQNRRIFFMPAWLDGFINARDDATALLVVDQFLATASIEDDIRRKILQSRDGLRRSVAIRAAFPAAQ
jgi:aminopeptidase N